MKAFVEEYLAYIKLEKNLSDNSIASYENDLSRFLDYLGKLGMNDWSEVSSKNISEFFNILRENEIKSSTVARYLSSIKGLFKYLHQCDYIKRNPTEILSSHISRRKLLQYYQFMK